MDSCNFHYKLYLCDDPGIFATETVSSYVKFKAAQSVYYFWIYAFPYIVYMIGLVLATMFDYKQLRSGWFIGGFALIQSIQLGLNIYLQPMAIKQKWVLFDLIRLAFMYAFTLANLFFKGNHFTSTQIFMVLNIISYFGILKYLRRAAAVRVYITLVFASIAAMANFLIIFVIVVFAFLSSQMIKSKYTPLA